MINPYDHSSIVRPRQIGESYWFRRVSKEKEKLIINKPCLQCKAIGKDGKSVAGFYPWHHSMDSDPYPSDTVCQEHLDKKEELQMSLERLQGY